MCLLHAWHAAVVCTETLAVPRYLGVRQDPEEPLSLCGLQKARLAHPDAVGSGNTPALNFAEVLVAYQVHPPLFLWLRHRAAACMQAECRLDLQVLTNARERQLYDLSIDTRTGRLAKEAASSEPVDR